MDDSLENVHRRTLAEQEKLRKMAELETLPTRMERLNSLSSAVTDAVDELEHKLRPVLRAQPDRMDTLRTARPEPETELAGFLESMAGRLESVLEALRGMQGRVDL